MCSNGSRHLQVDADCHINPELSVGYFCEEVMRSLFHVNSLSDPKDLLIPLPGANLNTCMIAALTPNELRVEAACTAEGNQIVAVDQPEAAAGEDRRAVNKACAVSLAYIDGGI